MKNREWKRDHEPNQSQFHIQVALTASFSNTNTSAPSHVGGMEYACVLSRSVHDLRTRVHQAPLYMGFSRQEYWSGLPFPSPRDLPVPGIEPAPPVSHALAGRSFTTVPPGKPRVGWGNTSAFIFMEVQHLF